VKAVTPECSLANYKKLRWQVIHRDTHGGPRSDTCGKHRERGRDAGDAADAGDLCVVASDGKPMNIKSRHHLRSDDVREIESALGNELGVHVNGDQYELVEFEEDEYDLVLVDGEPLVLYVDDEPFLTVRGANEYDPTSHVVTVDAGAVEFVSDGADVMRPGITEADETIAEGDLVVIVEEAHGKALAVGRAMVDGDDLLGDSGKVIESLHHVGDELYGFAP
jgi:PUA-domain protein